MPDRFAQYANFGIQPSGATQPPSPQGYVGQVGAAAQGAGSNGPFTITNGVAVPKSALIVVAFLIGGDVATDATGVAVGDDAGNTYHTVFTGVSTQQPNVMFAYALALSPLAVGQKVTFTFAGWSGFGSFDAQAAAFGMGDAIPSYVAGSAGQTYANGARDVSHTTATAPGQLVVATGGAINAGSGSPILDTSADAFTEVSATIGNGHTSSIMSYLYTNNTSETYSIHDTQTSTRNVACGTACFQQ